MLASNPCGPSVPVASIRVKGKTPNPRRLRSTTMSNTPTGTPVIVELPKENLPRPEAANFFHFSFSGPEIQLLIGFLDVNDILRRTGVRAEAASV